jgi:integrase/recombinase XerD
MKRGSIPLISRMGQETLAQYESYLRSVADVSPITIRNYLSDLRQFMAWCEETDSEGQEIQKSFVLSTIATPTITCYRSYLQNSLLLKPASVNRYLVTLKCYFAWVTEIGLIDNNPAAAVKLIPTVDSPPRHLSNAEESALVAAVTNSGHLRDRTIIVLMLHTGLRAQEVCTLHTQQVHLGKRSGILQVYGKRNKYRQVPLNATARAVLMEYIKTRTQDTNYLFVSEKTGEALTERGLGYLVKKYAYIASLTDVSPHDLRHRFGYRMAQVVPLHRLAQIMGHDSLDTTMIYIRGTQGDLQKEVEKIAWE